MHITVTHITKGQDDYEYVEASGASYEEARDAAIAQVPAGRIAAVIRVQR